MKSAAKKRPRRPVYFVVARAGDVPREAGVLVPLTKWDQRTMRARKMGLGTELRAELKQRRNVKFHRLAHAIGTLVGEQVGGFEGLDAHAVLKRLQEDADLFCDTEYIDASPVVATILAIVRSVIGDAPAEMLKKVLPSIKKIAIRVPRSIAFDECDEAEFQQLIAGIYAHLRQRYWPTMTEDAIAQMVEIYERDS
jgi:hypothetical protein